MKNRPPGCTHDEVTIVDTLHESVGLVPLSSYLVRLNVLGGMHPDQTYNFATHGEHHD